MEDRPLPVYDSMASVLCVCALGSLAAAAYKLWSYAGLSVPRCSMSLGNRYICIIHIYLPSLFTDYCPDSVSHCLNNMAAPESDNIELHGHPPFQ